MALCAVGHQVVVKTVNADPALAPQLRLLGSPSDPVGRFIMRASK
jgi:hypothetical protein